MDKTLGQIAFEALPSIGGWRSRWDELIAVDHKRWEICAAVVAAAVKEEDARICDALFAEDAALAAAGVEAPKYRDAIECGAAIRASIKEVK